MRHRPGALSRSMPACPGGRPRGLPHQLELDGLIRLKTFFGNICRMAVDLLSYPASAGCDWCRSACLCSVERALRHIYPGDAVPGVGLVRQLERPGLSHVAVVHVNVREDGFSMLSGCAIAQFGRVSRSTARNPRAENRARKDRKLETPVLRSKRQAGRGSLGAIGVTDRPRRCAHRLRPEPASTMPAPTVSLVASSIRMKLPVRRLPTYGSKTSGALVRSRTRPMSLSSSSAGAGARSSVCTSTRSSSASTIAVALRVVCLITYLPPAPQRRVRSASRRRPAARAPPSAAAQARQISSPRETSSSSSRRSVTDIGASASSSSPS